MVLSPSSLPRLCRGARPYPLYVLSVLMVVYLVNQMDRFLLGIASKDIANDLHFAKFGCFPDTSAHLPHNASCVGACTNIRNETDATGVKYEVLAGPAFTLIFTIAAIPLAVMAGYHWMNRKVAIAVALVMWSVMTGLAGFTQTFWQFLLTRVGLGVFEAVCTPFATSIISDYFEEKSRGAALGVYNWGIYIGYSLAFAFNYILIALDWRWTFWISALPGFILGVVVIVTIKEPKRRMEMHLVHGRGSSMIKKVFRSYLQPSLLLLCVAGGVRQGGGLVWAYNVKAYFDQYYCGEVNVGLYLSWIPLVGGVIGALVGGYVSDRLVKSRGTSARLWVLILSQLAASPFLFGAIFLPPTPWAFLSLIPAYAVGEMWIGVCLAIVIGLVPIEVASAGIALFLFIINNIGGAMTLLVPALEMAIGLQYALVVLLPGLYVIAAGLFAVTLLVMRCGKVERRREERGKMDETSRLIQDRDSDSSDSDYDEVEESLGQAVAGDGARGERLEDWAFVVLDENVVQWHTNSSKLAMQDNGSNLLFVSK